MLFRSFAVINANDFYRRDSFAVIGEELLKSERKENTYCMVNLYGQSENDGEIGADVYPYAER